MIVASLAMIANEVVHVGLPINGRDVVITKSNKISALTGGGLTRLRAAPPAGFDDFITANLWHP
jgi:hypothetical protein